MKFALMKYKFTTNLGNEIQSIAARQFLPTVDYYIEHEKLNLFENPEKVKMIMNGWYMDCIESWPPSESINPLLISMHFNTSFNNTKEVIATQKSRDYFSSYGPVGCRDISTLNLLNELDIDAYYSGDLTLTLNSQNNENRYKYIVVNANNSNKIVSFLKTKTDLDIYVIQHESIESLDQKYLNRKPISYTLTSFYDIHDKFFIAENFLRMYDNAYCVITDRVHCALPCLAFNTPVLFFNTRSFAPERLTGLDELLIQSNLEDYKENYDIFDVENPPKNPQKYLKIRETLIRKAKDFTGYHNSGSCFMYCDNDYENYQTELLSRTAIETRNYMRRVIRLSNMYESKISKLQNDFETQKDELINKFRSEISDKNNIILKQSELINRYETLNSNFIKEIEKLKR